MKRLPIYFATLLIATAGWTQKPLTLEEAFQLALQNNYQLKILDNRVEVAENNANMGNAGLLPNATVSGSYGVNVTDTRQEFADPRFPIVDQKGALTENTSASATVNYTLFRGLSAQRTYQRLMINAKAVDAQSRAEVEGTLLQVAKAYYQLAGTIEQEAIVTANVTISKQRYERAKLAHEFGTALRTDFLSSRVALTSDSSILLRAQLQRENAQRNLERLIGKQFEVPVETSDINIELQDWTLEQLQNQALQNNAAVKNAELQVALAKKDYQLSWSSAFPSLSLSGGYSYSNQQNEAGFILSNTQTGWNGSIGLSYPIFTGFRNRTERQNRMIAVENSELQLQDQQLQLRTDLANAWGTYQQSIRTYQFERENLESAELNLQRTEAQFKAGQVTNAQFREAQRDLALARQRINDAEISIKLNELEIMRLTGQILSQE